MKSKARLRFLAPNHELNQTIHRISFESASRVFADDFCLIYPDRIDEETGDSDGTL